MRPVRILCWSTRAIEPSMRVASWLELISMLKIATGKPFPTATCSALHRAIAHQLRVAPDVDGAGGVLRQRREVGGTAGLVLVFAALDRVGDRDDVRRLVVLHHLDDVAPDAAVIVTIEVLAGEEVADLVERLVVHQQRAQ